MKKHNKLNKITSSNSDDDGIDQSNKSKSKPEYNLATVFDGARSVRQFDLETHGEGFETLAEAFASKFNYRVELGNLKGKLECPSCGHRFNQ